MQVRLWARVALGAAVAAFAVSGAALAQKSGGILRIYHMDNPPSASMHEEATISTNGPFMAIYNNLVIYDQNKPKNSIETIVPELATSWEWNADKSQLRFKLRQGVKWHDGKPFTAKDVQCTYDMVRGVGDVKLRKSPRDAWFNNIDKIVVEGDYEVAFLLKRPQPSMIALLAAGYVPVYPCHVTPAQMRTKPVGTGPFKFAEFRQNEVIRLVKNPDYWKPGRPYLDGIEYTIITSRSTRILAFVSGKFDMTWPTDVSVPLLKDVKAGAPNAQCTMRSTNVETQLIINRDLPPFNNPDIRMALALTLDRKAFIDIISEGEATVGAAMLPAPDGLWGMPKEMLLKLPGYDPDIKKNREQARELMKKAGYGPDKRIKTKVSTRDIPTFRDPAVILIDQLKEIYIDADLDVIETSVYYTKVFKKEYTVGLNLTGSAVDDPDQHFYENYACGSLRNYTGYCNKDMEALFEQQSRETDPEKRLKLVWDIDKKLQEDVARPVIMHNKAAACWHPHVKGLTIMVNSIYNGHRYEDLWLDK
jgi:peptide/nickel transport system substrate-binding protein